MKLTILIADDDAVLRHLICDMLRKQQYIPIEAANGRETLDIFFSRNDIDLVILDVMMPIYDGREVLREIREHSDVPVLMLTALGEEKDEVSGLRGGADDYISKPFSYTVFMARIDSLLRKTKKEQTSRLSAGDLDIDQVTHKVSICKTEIPLNNKEYNLLLYLVKNRGIVVDREKILAAVWGYNFEGDIRTIDVHVKMIRSKMLHCGDYIRTIRGSGYTFEVNDEKDN
jgi:two-component system response regulator ResD